MTNTIQHKGINMDNMHVLNLAIDLAQILSCILGIVVTFYPD